MREIKFRAWNGEKYVINNFDIEDMMSGIYMYSTSLEFQQFTGLKDAQGKEVYEGDILDAIEMNHVYFPNRFVIEKHALAFMLVGITPNASPNCEFTLSTITNKEIDVIDYAKVIGNIYENPELCN